MKYTHIELWGTPAYFSDLCGTTRPCARPKDCALASISDIENLRAHAGEVERARLHELAWEDEDEDAEARG
jgi:hypothetical protein